MALPQLHRLKGQRVIDGLYQRGRRLHGPLITLRWLAAEPGLLPPPQRCQPASPWRCGVVISTKVSKRAVRRNRLRRQLHHHLLQHPPGSREPVWLLISLRPGCAEADPVRVLGECSDLLRKAGLLP